MVQHGAGDVGEAGTVPTHGRADAVGDAFRLSGRQDDPVDRPVGQLGADAVIQSAALGGEVQGANLHKVTVTPSDVDDNPSYFPVSEWTSTIRVRPPVTAKNVSGAPVLPPDFEARAVQLTSTRAATTTRRRMWRGTAVMGGATAPPGSGGSQT